MTINIGNLHMTCDLLKGNPRMLMYAGCNADSRIQYVSFNGDSFVYATQHLEKLYSKLV